MTPIETPRKLVEYATRTYDEGNERAALRCGLGDAAALCDAIATAILDETRSVRRKSATAEGLKLSAIATRCGDEIFSMREMVDVPQRPRRMIWSDIYPDGEGE